MTNDLEKVIVLDSQITNIFKNLLDPDMLESERMTSFISTKASLEKTKASLQVAIDGSNIALKERSEALMVKINNFLKEFKDKYLSVKSTDVDIDADAGKPQTTKEDVVSANVNTEKSTFYIINSNILVDTVEGTKQQLADFLSNIHAGKDDLIVIEGRKLEIKTKVVFDIA